MNIMEVGGASHHAAFAPVGAVSGRNRPKPGSADHDGDSDDAAKAAQASSSVGRLPRLRPYAALAVHTSVVWIRRLRRGPRPVASGAEALDVQRARATPARRAAAATIVVNRSGPQMNTFRSDRSGMLALRV